MKLLSFLSVFALLPSISFAIPMPDTPAPDFETEAVIPVKNNPAGKLVKNFKLSSLIGKSRILLLSYPKNCTFICPTELIALKNKMPEFHKLGYEVLVLSVDEASLEKDRESSHQAWRLKPDNPRVGDKNTPMGIGNADFIMLSDPNRKIIKQYGIEGSNGMAYRATFFIGTDGKVHIADVQSINIGRNIDDILNKAANLKFVEEHEGMVTPEGWKPGDKGMKPDHSGVREQMKTK